MGLGGRIVFVVLAILVLGGILLFAGSDGETMENMNVKLETSEGDVVVELFLSDMPVTAGNFKKLVEEGFYDGLIFHRVIPGFMIQGGDPKGDGTGGPGYTIKDEFGDVGNERGTLSMANAGPNTGGSQFFVNVADNNFLDGKHPVFGKVVEGMDVVDLIVGVAKDAGDKPVNDVKIKKASVMS
jgi:peptidylprolyl isomerase